jgi:hypothetical protein
MEEKYSFKVIQSGQTNRFYAVFDSIINANTDAILSLQALQG